MNMNYLHYEFSAGSTDIVEVTLDRAANVLLLDSGNYSNYRNRHGYKYYGGYATVSPYRIIPPHYGSWHLVVDLGGGAGTVRAAVQIIPKVQQGSNDPAIR